MTQQPYAEQPYPQQPYPPQGAYGQGYPPPPGHPQQEKGGGLAIAALVLGIIGLLLSWIPIINYLALVLGVVGLVLGVVGIFKSRRVMSIVGAVLSFLAIVVSIVVFAAFADAVDEAVNEVNASMSPGSNALEGGDAALDAEVEANADAGGPAPNARGNILAGFGEEGGITDEAGADVLTFAVDGITVDPACTSDYADYGTPVGPGHHLVAVQMHVATTPLVSDDDFLSVSGYDFRFIGADGITVDSLDGISTYGCLEDSQTFTSDILGPGQQYAGTVLLDVPAAAGTLVFDPSWGQTGGWEYNF